MMPQVPMIKLSSEQCRCTIRQPREVITHGPLEISIEAIWKTRDKLGRASQTRSSFDCGVIMSTSRVSKGDVFSNL
jgi:hypothetical protein